MRRAPGVVALSLALAACQGKQADAGKSAAAAEVLPGSASDAMIAYDTLKSQPPLAVAVPPADAGAKRAAGAGDDGAAAEVANPLASGAAPVAGPSEPVSTPSTIP